MRIVAHFSPMAAIVVASLGSACWVSAACGQPLAAPSDLVAQASAPGDLAISLFWIDNSFGEDGFEIQRRTGDNSTFETVGIVPLANVSSYNDVGLLENTTYTYRVRAISATEVSDFSNSSSATTSYARPNQVSNLQGTYMDGLVELTWVDNANNETRFEVERAEVGVSTFFEVIATLPPDATAYVDGTALDGTMYIYRVVPWRFDVFGGAPETVTIETAPGIAAPTSVRAKAKNATTIELSWKGRFPNNAMVQVQRFDELTGTWATLGLVSACNKKFTNTGLAPRTLYTYRIRTVTNTAVSPWQTVSATTR